MHTPEKWHSFGRVNMGIAVTYTLIGFMFEILYFPCLYVSQNFKSLLLYFLGDGKSKVSETLVLQNHVLFGGY
jgi:hypothetical protein